jgi:hypothetical protein
MVKKGPLGKVEIFYLEKNIELGLSLDQIAVDLNRNLSTIKNYIDKHYTKPSNNNPFNVGSQFISQNGATIMTENASTLSDSTKKLSRKQSPCTTKIKR